MEEIKLTQYSHGAGCGCKISPKNLETILKTELDFFKDKNVLVGYGTKDDAAVYDMGDGNGIISTTDFFMPIVDDPFDFGRIAATNAISDIYAMGGKPLMAIAILGWPIQKLPVEIAAKVIDGARKACSDAGIMVAGGHSIDNMEPLFGLAVTGIVALENLKRNDNATPNCSLYLTKPLGVGILSTAQKKGILKTEDQFTARNSMIALNKVGTALGKIKEIKSLTDVTGFGLAGHLLEMCEGSNLEAHVDFKMIPQLPNIQYYIDQNAIPGGTNRNWDSYGDKIWMENEEMKSIICDPQTSGGLLIAIEESGIEILENTLLEYGLSTYKIGSLNEYKGKERIYFLEK
ncbi:MAG: selenide, water dikinase SelD [Bacteroidetes bacterium]|nr:selenide, water dikinase SelD [Bacteroidota bacterium]